VVFNVGATSLVFYVGATSVVFYVGATSVVFYAGATSVVLQHQLLWQLVHVLHTQPSSHTIEWWRLYMLSLQTLYVLLNKLDFWITSAVQW